MIAIKTNSSTNASINQPPKITVLNTLKNYFTKTSSRLLQHTNNIHDSTTIRSSPPTNKTVTLIQKIKTATTLKLKNLSKRIDRKKQRH